MPYRLAMFDFDGTLADSLPFFLSVFNTLAERHAFRPIDLAASESIRHYSVREMRASQLQELAHLFHVPPSFIKQRLADLDLQLPKPLTLQVNRWLLE